MRIAHVIDHLAMGGAQRVIGDLLRCWPNDEDEFEVISMGYQAEFAPQLADLPRVRLHCLDGGRWDIGVVRQTARLLTGGNFDVVHAHLAKAICAALWTQPKLSAPLVVHAHCDPDRDSRLLRLVMKYWKHRLGAMIAVSDRTADIARRWYGLEHRVVHPIANGIDFERLDSQATAFDLRQRLGISRDAFIVGMLGRLHPQKGVTYLIQAMQQVRQSRQDIVAVLIGDGPLEDELKREAKQRGLDSCMHFVGRQSDIASWIRGIDVGVLPSEFEGLPLVAIEIMSMGKTMIATDVSGNSEVVVHEQTGLLVPTRDPRALAAAILRMAHTPKLVKQLAERAERHVRDGFSSEQQGLRVRELYETILSQPLKAAV